MIYTEDRIMAEAATAPAFGLDRLWNEVGDLGLQRHIEDLDGHGYTVIPPEIASPNGRSRQGLRPPCAPRP